MAFSGSKAKWYNQLLNKLTQPSPTFDPGQQPYQQFGYQQQQFLASQHQVPNFGQQQFQQQQQHQPHSPQGDHYSGPANVSGQGRQHVGAHIQGDDSRTHASDNATQYNDRVHYANTYNYYYQTADGFVAGAGRTNQTSSAPPAGNTFSPPPGRPNLPPRQEGATSAPPQPQPQPQTHPASSQANSPDLSRVIHLANCDACGTQPIRGMRYRCLTCPDHDVCQKCKDGGLDEGHSYKQLPSAQERPLHLSALGQAAAQGSQYGILSYITPGCMVELCDHPRGDPLVLAARNGHFKVVSTLWEKLGAVYPRDCVQAAIQSARTCTQGFMGPVMAQYLESQATLVEHQKAQGLYGTYGL